MYSTRAQWRCKYGPAIIQKCGASVTLLSNVCWSQENANRGNMPLIEGTRWVHRWWVIANRTTQIYSVVGIRTIRERDWPQLNSFRCKRNVTENLRTTRDWTRWEKQKNTGTRRRRNGFVDCRCKAFTKTWKEPEVRQRYYYNIIFDRRSIGIWGCDVWHTIIDVMWGVKSASTYE